jgi:hypothetical protein
MKTPYTLCPPAVVGAAAAFARMSGPVAAPPVGASVRLLPLPDWSKISVISQYVSAQKESCVAEFAYPPALSG